MMRHGSWSIVGGLAALLVASACTQDFDQFAISGGVGGTGTGTATGTNTGTQTGTQTGDPTGGGGTGGTATGAGGSPGGGGTGGTATGMGGGGEGGGMPLCGELPQPPGQGCPAPCTDCNNGTCEIDCSATDCTVPITCPPDYACEVTCGGTDCDGLDLTCPATYGCDVTCNGGCNDGQVTGSTGTVTVSCQTNSCVNTALVCGTGQCNGTCSGNGTLDITCGPTCECNDMCM